MQSKVRLSQHPEETFFPVEALVTNCGVGHVFRHTQREIGRSERKLFGSETGAQNIFIELEDCGPGSPTLPAYHALLSRALTHTLTHAHAQRHTCFCNLDVCLKIRKSLRGVLKSVIVYRRSDVAPPAHLHTPLEHTHTIMYPAPVCHDNATH